MQKASESFYYKRKKVNAVLLPVPGLSVPPVCLRIIPDMPFICQDNQTVVHDTLYTLDTALGSKHHWTDIHRRVAVNLVVETRSRTLNTID